MEQKILRVIVGIVKLGNIECGRRNNAALLQKVENYTKQSVA